MSGADSIDLTRPIFEEPPDDLGQQEFHFGTLILSLGGLEGLEVARAFAEAGDRLIEAAAIKNESWEAACPILFSYRHALELYLKVLLPLAPRNHKLAKLAQLLEPQLQGYQASHVTWLLARVAEFDRVDPSSTVFRYHDGAQMAYKVGNAPDPELWVDFHHLRKITRLLFEALETVRLHQLDRGRGST